MALAHWPPSFSGCLSGLATTVGLGIAGLAVTFFTLSFFALPIGAAVGCFAAVRGSFSVWRLVVPFVAILVGLFGVFAMLEWRNRYVEPMLHGAYPQTSSGRLTTRSSEKEPAVGLVCMARLTWPASNA